MMNEEDEEGLIREQSDSETTHKRHRKSDDELEDESQVHDAARFPSPPPPKIKVVFRRQLQEPEAVVPAQDQVPPRAPEPPPRFRRHELFERERDRNRDRDRERRLSPHRRRQFPPPQQQRDDVSRTANAELIEFIERHASHLGELSKWVAQERTTRSSDRDYDALTADAKRVAMQMVFEGNGKTAMGEFVLFPVSDVEYAAFVGGDRARGQRNMQAVADWFGRLGLAGRCCAARAPVDCATGVQTSWFAPDVQFLAVKRQ